MFDIRQVRKETFWGNPYYVYEITQDGVKIAEFTEDDGSGLFDASEFLRLKERNLPKAKK